MTSLGESDLQIDQYIVGRVRVMDFHAPASVEPRLVFRFGASFTVRREWMEAKQLTAEALALRGASGELLLPDGRFVAPLEWVGAETALTSAAYFNECQFHLACSLGWSRILRLEDARDGKGPQFQIRLFPRMTLGANVITVRDVTIGLKVPLENWCSFLDQLGGERVELVQVRLPSSWRNDDALPIAQLREARRMFDSGHYDGAMIACRKSLEGIAQRIEKGDVAEVLKKFFIGSAGEKKGDAVAAIAGKARHLASLALHETGSSEFSRPEAELLIRVVEGLIAYAGAVMPNAKAASG